MEIAISEPGPAKMHLIALNLYQQFKQIYTFLYLT